MDSERKTPTCSTHGLKCVQKSIFGEYRRAIKTVVFEGEETGKVYFLRKYLKVHIEKSKDSSLSSADRWEYKERVRVEKRELRRELGILYKVNNRIIGHTFDCPSAEILSSRVLSDRLCCKRRFYCFELLKKIQALNIEFNQKLNEQARDLTRIVYERSVNYFNLLEYEEEDYYDSPLVQALDVEQPSVAQPKLKQESRRRIFHTRSQFTENPYVETTYTRDASLLYKLHRLLDAFRDARSRGSMAFSNAINKIYAKYISNCEPAEEIELAEIAVPQMDAEGESTVEIDKKQNVVLTETQGVSSVVTAPKSMNWVPYLSSDTDGAYVEMTDRWLKFCQFVWNKDHLENQILKQLTLPYDVVINAEYKMCDVPNTIPFKVHRYWTGDMEIKIQINSNRFQIGQLQCAWWYQPEMDENFSLRTNKYSGSQTSHVLVSAGSSNEGVLTIPYKNHMPMIPTRKRKDTTNYLNLGKLYIIVMNPLSVPNDGPGQCYVSIFCRFKNSHFTGQISGALDEVAVHQMERILEGAAMGALGALCPNMDNIQDTRNSQYVVPIATHSWCFGNGISEPLQALRLNPRGMTQHPDATPSETRISDVVQKYGLLTTVLWNKQYETGKLLFHCDASPLLSKESYYTISNTDKHNLNLYYVPPVGVVSSLYNFWRGNLRFRFDIVSSQFHTGRLIVGYVPGVLTSTNVQLKHILAGPHVVFTLQEDNQFVYEVPYIADRPFWAKKYQGNYLSDQVLAPSRLYMFVLNPLIPMETITDSVYINIYMSGSSNFEVAIPVQPAIGLGWNKYVLYDSSEMIVSTNAPYYPGKWHDFDNSKTLMMRSGQLSDQVAYWDFKFLKKSTYNTEKKRSISYYYQLSDYKDPAIAVLNGGRTPLYFGCLVWADDAHTSAIMVPMRTAQDAQNFSKLYNINGSYISFAIPAGDTTSNEFCKGNPYWIAKLWAVDIDSFEETAHFEGEREEGRNIVSTGYPLLPTGSGYSLYGESFNDLKDLLRRYQTYDVFNVDPDIKVELGLAIANVPLLPQGLDLQIGSISNIIELTNRCREGHIPLILSGYRYYRGGMRMRIVFPTKKDLVCWVQHRPDRKLMNRIHTMCVELDSANCLANHSYASFIQDCGVNSILQIEIPYYKNNAYNLLQQVKLTDMDEMYSGSLGQLVIGGMYSDGDRKDLQKYKITLYYSVADDFHCSTFQGFPPIVLLDDIAQVTEVAQHQMVTDEDDGEITLFEVDHCVEATEEADSQGIFDSLRKSVTEEVKETVTETAAEILEPILDEAKTTFEKFKQSLEDKSMGELLNVSVVRTILSQVAHVIANFNVKSLVIALVSIIVEIGVCTIEASRSLVTMFTTFITSLQNKLGISKKTENVAGNQQKPPDTLEEASHNMDVESEDGKAVLGIITVLWTALCTTFSVIDKPCKNISDFGKILTKDVSLCLKSANVVFVFVRNILTVLDAMKLKIIGYISPKYKALKFLDESQAYIQAWAHEVVALDDPWQFEKEKYTQKFKARVHVAYTQGRLIYMNITEIKDSRINKAITDLYRKIRELREKMLEFGDDSFVRREPFVLWQFGQPGVGKSTLTHDVAMALLKSRGEVFNVPPIYNHSVASDFWDSCHNNPFMVVDDAFNVTEGEMLYRYIQIMFTVVSPAILIPNQARLEQKGKAYNPVGFIINSNKAFLRLNNIEVSAIHRRRNILVNIELTPPKPATEGEEDCNIRIPGCPHCHEGITDLTKIDKKWLKDYHHLTFSIAINVVHNEGYGPKMIYKEYIDYLVREYDRISVRNEHTYMERVNEVMECIGLSPFEAELETQEDYKNKVQAILNKQQSYVSNLANECIFKQLRQSLSVLGTISKEHFSRMVLKTCTMIGRTRGILQNVPVDPKAAYLTEDSKTITLDEFLLDVAEGQLENATKIMEYDKAHWDTFFDNPFDFKHALYVVFPEREITMLLTEEQQDILNGENNRNAHYRLEVDDIINQMATEMNTRKSLLTKYWFLGRNGEPNIFSSIEFWADVVHWWVNRESHVTIRCISLNVKPKTCFSFSNFLDMVRQEERLQDMVKKAMRLETRQTELHFENLPLCKHFLYDPSKLEYCTKNGAFMYENERFDCACVCPKVSKKGNASERLDCPWTSMIYKKMFFDEYLIYNPDVEYKSKLSLYANTLPRELVARNIVPEIYTSTFKKILLELKRKAFDCALKLSKVPGIVWSALKSFGKFLWTWLPIFLPAIAVLGLGTIAAYCAPEPQPVAFNWVGNPAVGQSMQYSGIKNNNPHWNAQVPLLHARPQGEIPQLNVALDRVKKNMFRITAISGNKIIRCDGLIIESRKLLLLRHYLEEFQNLSPDTQFYGKFSHRPDVLEGSYGVRLNLFELETVYYTSNSTNIQSNFVLVMLPLTVCESKSIKQFIATQRDHTRFSGVGMLFVNDGKIFSGLKVIRENTKPILIKESEHASRVILQDMYTYREQGRGMCGSVLFAEGLERPIIGLHVAGIERGNIRGIAEPLVYESFANLPLKENDYKAVLIPDLTDVEFSKIKIDSMIYPVGCVALDNAAHHIGISKIVPSRIQGVFPVRTEPAPLSMSDERLPKGSRPLEDGIAHKGKPPLDFNTMDLYDAAIDFSILINKTVIPTRGKVGLLDYQEVVCGIKGLPGYESLEMSTSPGYPLRFNKDTSTQKGKKWLFNLQETPGEVPVLLGFHPKLEKQLTFEKNLRNRGIRPFTVFIDCLKDSCIPVEKCRIPGKTRIFSISPVQFTIEFKRYFNDFTAAYQGARLNAEHAIGIDVNSVEWTDLATKLLNNGDKLVCGDYKNYGPGLMSKAAQAAFFIILEWYRFHGDEENNIIRRIMIGEIMEAYYLAENLIYTTPCGIPSGSPITTPLNSLVGSLYIRVAWKKITNLSFKHMYENIVTLTYGDDVIISVKDAMIDVFNTESLSNFFSSYNIGFTDADKSNNVIKYRSIDTATFLKNHFAPHPTRQGLWIAQLDKVSIEGCANWINGRNNKDLATIENCEQTLNLAHGHGKEYYDHIHTKLIKAMSEVDLTFRSTSWEDIDFERYSNLTSVII